MIPRLVYRIQVSPDGTLDGYLNHSLSYFRTTDFQPNSAPTNSSSTPEFCRYPDYRESPDSSHPYERTLFFWTVMAARVCFIVIFEVMITFSFWRFVVEMLNACRISWPWLWFSYVGAFLTSQRLYEIKLDVRRTLPMKLSSIKSRWRWSLVRKEIFWIYWNEQEKLSMHTVGSVVVFPWIYFTVLLLANGMLRLGLGERKMCRCLNLLFQNLSRVWVKILVFLIRVTDLT